MLHHTIQNPYWNNCLPGPALVFEGEESMMKAISEDPMSFKVRKLHGYSASYFPVDYSISITSDSLILPAKELLSTYITVIFPGESGDH